MDDPLQYIDGHAISYIFHLANKNYVSESWVLPEKYYMVNVQGTIKILEYCKKYNIPLTYISSYIYGSNVVNPISETAAPSPESPYAHSKYLAEQVCRFYSDNYGVKVKILRPFNVYGIGQRADFVIPHIINQAVSGNAVRVKNSVTKRDFVNVIDLVEALVMTMEDPCVYSVYNVGSGCSISIKDLVEIIGGILGVSLSMEDENIFRKNEIMDCFADISKIKSAYNWYPKTSIHEGLSKYISQLIGK
jgi:nucleoside-diphosphate-sugar epimerase